MDLTSRTELRARTSSLRVISSGYCLPFALLFSVSCLLLPTLAFAQSQVRDKVTLNITGNCSNYQAFLSAHKLPPQCYDVKVDVTSPGGRVGEVYDPRSGWQSSFFYVKDHICPASEQSNTSVSFNTSVKLRVPHSARDISFRGKLRPSTESGPTYETRPHDLTQNCPQQSPTSQELLPEEITIVSLLVMIVLLAGLAYYRRRD